MLYKTKITSTEFVQLFLAFHGVLMSKDIIKRQSCDGYIKSLSLSFTPHIATESFTSFKLQQVVINTTIVVNHLCIINIYLFLDGGYKYVSI
jgi:hypothetical protein